MDSELQIALVGLGLIVVVGIVAYNKWQERKHRKHAERAFKSDHRDVLLEQPAKKEKRIEPRVGHADDDVTDDAFADDQPVAGVPAPSGSSLGGRHSTPGVPGDVDEKMDCFVLIESIEPLEVHRLWTAQHEQLGGLSRAVRWFAFDDAANLWRTITAHSAGAYHWFCAAMQIVDRRGAIGEQEFRAFSDGVQRVADQFLAVPSGVPTCGAVLANAAEIDRFCANVDVQVGINLISNGTAFPGTKIRALAEAEGMVLGQDGSFHAFDDEGSELFTLCNLEPSLFSESEMRYLQTHGLTLLLDVPHVADGAHVFDRMMRQANHMAKVLDGRIVDDNRAPFGPEAAEFIRSQIKQFQTLMSEQRIPAGSDAALRLFSAQ